MYSSESELENSVRTKEEPASVRCFLISKSSDISMLVCSSHPRKSLKSFETFLAATCWRDPNFCLKHMFSVMWSKNDSTNAVLILFLQHLNTLIHWSGAVIYLWQNMAVNIVYIVHVSSPTNFDTRKCVFIRRYHEINFYEIWHNRSYSISSITLLAIVSNN